MNVLFFEMLNNINGRKLYRAIYESYFLKLVKQNIGCHDRVKKAIMRAAIWNHYMHNLQSVKTELDVTKSDTKTIWDNLQNYLPLYTLFHQIEKTTMAQTTNPIEFFSSRSTSKKIRIRWLRFNLCNQRTRNFSTENQKMLIRSLLILAESPNTQIIITTHSASIVKD